MRVLQDKAKKLAEENKTLKAETDRLRQQFLTQSTTTKAPLRPRSNKTESSSLNLIAVLLIIVALVMGYFVGTYTS
jgi:vesicle-associated membrane protein-associated protein A